ncbi:MAG: DUF4340 domain-containing protein, partial [Nitrospirae bacterium]
MSRAVQALLIVALGLGLYLWLVELPAERKRVEAETTAKKLVDFQEDDIQGFTISSSRGEIEVAREDGRWTIRKPKPMEADATAVGEFLRTLMLAQVTRVVDDTAADLKAYGLETPSLTVSLRLASGTQTVRVGDAGPLTATLYAKRDDSPKVLLTTLAGRDLLTKSIQEFRRKRVLPFNRLQVTRVKIAGPRETVVLYREGEAEKAMWKIKAPIEAAADQPEVRSLLFALEDLKAQAFIDDPKERAAKRAALGKPLATITLREGETDRTVSLFLDPRDNTAAFAESASQEPLYRITPATAKDLAKGLFDLRGKQLIAAEPDQVRTLVIKTGGQEYSLSREGSDWLVDGDPKAKADAARVNMFVTRAVRLQAEKIVTEKPTDLKPYGLASPTAELIAA